MRLEAISLRRGDRIENRSLVIDLKLPEGFEHYYRPFSTISILFLVKIINPQDMRFFQETLDVTRCLCRKVVRLALDSIQRCFDVVSSQSFYPRWLVNLIGFTIVCSIILLVAFIMLLLCPCLMCWRISFKPVVQAGKLDTYSNWAWATLTISCCLAMLFMLIGLIAVGWGGIGLSYYLYDSQTTRMSVAYDQIELLAKHAMKDARKQTIHKQIKLTVSFFTSHFSVVYDTIRYDMMCLRALKC